jgi:hypothetical protein
MELAQLRSVPIHEPLSLAPIPASGDREASRHSNIRRDAPRSDVRASNVLTFCFRFRKVSQFP